MLVYCRPHMKWKSICFCVSVYCAYESSSPLAQFNSFSYSRPYALCIRALILVYVYIICIDTVTIFVNIFRAYKYLYICILCTFEKRLCSELFLKTHHNVKQTVSGNLFISLWSKIFITCILYVNKYNTGSGN